MINKLSKRLDTIIQLAGKGNTVADIGTDHAYVPISLIKNKAFSKAIAADINPNAVNIAAENIKACRLQNNIDCVLSNGLRNIESSPDCIVISGMGGELMSEIIKADIEKIKNAEKLVLQPQTKSELLRKTLFENNINIIDEKIIYEENHYYIIILTGKKPCFQNKIIAAYNIESFFMYGLLPLTLSEKKEKEVFQSYLSARLREYENILGSIINKKVMDSERIKELELKLATTKALIQ